MSAFNVILPLGLSLLAFSLSGSSDQGEYPAESRAPSRQGYADIISELYDSTALEITASDTSWPDMLGRSLRHGIDTTVRPCDDFYLFANGGWRNQTVFDPKSLKPHRVSFFSDVGKRAKARLNAIIDSAHSFAATTTDNDLRVIGEFFASCMAADSLNLRTRIVLDSSKFRAMERKDTLSRQERCYGLTKTHLGEAIGQIYTREMLPPKALSGMETLLVSVHKAVQERLKGNPWMTENDKGAALERLAKLKLRVGLPPQKIDYSGVRMGPNFQENIRTLETFYRDVWYRSVGIDRSDQWRLSLINPNAFYMALDHAIEVPPVMFVPPFFDPEAEDVINFASIGHIIGHEIYHSVAFQLGILEGSEREVHSERLKKLHTSLGSMDGWEAYGHRTFSEDVADLGGVSAAYSAWKTTMKEKGVTAQPIIDGFTPEQRFFLAVARVWRSKSQGVYGRNDVHGPPFARINGTLMNIPEFAEAFGCKDTDRMVLPAEKRSRIW